jgi:hypothetical protein
MTRSKTTPSVHKPSFDEERTLRFAEKKVIKPDDAPVVADGGGQSGGKTDKKPGKNLEADRLHITLTLKPEVIARLKEEAERKEKTVGQVVEKLVAKHLGKH